MLATCLLAVVSSALGMSTVYYRDGQICDVCQTTNSDHSSHTYSTGLGQRVIVEERVVNRPSGNTVTSTQYVTNRDDNTHLDSSTHHHPIIAWH